MISPIRPNKAPAYDNNAFSSRADEHEVQPKVQPKPTSTTRKRTPFDDDFFPGEPSKPVQSSQAADDLFADITVQPTYNQHSNRYPVNIQTRPNKNPLFDFS